MNVNEPTIAVVGLPEAGKTTFLAALWHVVGSDEVPTSLRLDKLIGDKHHLNEIRDRWADCQKIDRTKISDETKVTMRLTDRAGGNLSEIVFTDMSGESFQTQWNERVCRAEYRQVIEEATGCLLFIHPRHVREAVLIRDAAVVAGSLANSANYQKQGQGMGQLPLQPNYASTQVQLVELLQFIFWMRGSGQTPLRIGVLISAWDVIEKLPGGRKMLPEAWLIAQLPLLHQYLQANPELFTWSAFGVSAQGGDLDDAARLRKAVRPSDRIAVVHEKTKSNDISLPVRWVLSLDNSNAG